MELPRRARGDELLKPGELVDIRARLRKTASRHDLTTVIACAFDHRTRMLPFTYSAVRIAPAGVRAIGSAMVDAGFEKTRIVLQQWNRSFRPSQMRLDGRVPDLFMVSSMRIHLGQCQALIRDACKIDPAHRPLIIAGGPEMLYEPWSVFGTDPADPRGVDVAVTGEEYVLLGLLEVLLSTRVGNEPMRAAFLRARDSGALDGIPGLIYSQTDAAGVARELVDTGIQRLVGDLDELPDPVLGYRILEPPSRRATLASHALPTGRIRRLSPIGSLVLTLGCKFTCPYCPIPAYNQRQYRVKSGRRIAEEMGRISREYGIHYFFGADDNFFNDRARAIEISETLAGAQIDGLPLRKRVRWGTEVTVHDTLRMKGHLNAVRKSGVRVLWLGVEDMTATLVNKGQSPDKTRQAFALLLEQGISPIAMMMHHDTQPLWTPGRPYGLLNQIRAVRKAGAVDLQALMLTPAPGSKQYEEAFTSGLVLASAGGRRVEPRMFDGNHVVASEHARPWHKQFNIIASHAYFYNPLRFLIALFRPKSRMYGLDAGVQVVGMCGLIKTIRRTLGWGFRLMCGKIQRHTKVPTSPIPMRSVDGGPASHALPGTPIPQYESPEPKDIRPEPELVQSAVNAREPHSPVPEGPGDA